MRSTPFSDGVRTASASQTLPAIVPLSQRYLARPQPLVVSPPHDEAAVLFRRIRQMAGLSPTQLAHRLHTSATVIDALEQGQFYRLPTWPETVVVVSGFTALAGVDPRPVLALIRGRLDAKIIDVPVSTGPRIESVPRAPKALTDKRTASGEISKKLTGKGEQISKQALSSAGRSMKAGWSKAGDVARSGLKTASSTAYPMMSRAASIPGLRHVLPPWRRSVVLGLLVTVPLAMLVSFGASGSLQAAVSALPWPVSDAARKVEDYILRATATEKEGLVWIEVSDPRSRKTDKLPSPRR